MATLALSVEMLGQFAKLERRAQTKLAEIADTFQRCTAQQLRDLKGLHLEAYKDAADPRARTIRIDDNHRGIVFDAGDDEHYVLTSIGTHDEVDRWMRQNTFRVNEVTGAFEILNLVEIEEAVGRVSEPEPEADRLFAHREDKDFTNLGVDGDLLPAVRALTTEGELEALISVLPQTVAEALIMLTGDDTVEALYRELAGSLVPGEVDTADVAAALNAPASQKSFHVVTDEDELAEMLALPLAQWRTFLHHTQKEVAYRPSYSGPARVTGGAGTGKTVVAMHRAKHLAEQLDGSGSGKPILFTTFTRNLAQVIERELRLLGGSDLLEVIDVINVDALSHRIVQGAEGSGPGKILDSDLREVWQQIVDDYGIDHTPEFLAAEWEHVILAQGIESRDEYFQASRAGRGVRLDRRSRARLWKAVEELKRRLDSSDQRSMLQLAEDAAGYLANRSVKPYRHVIVDEAQDLHETQWRMLRAAVDEGPDDMFIVGDTHQRIYDRQSSLAKVGIHIVGRSKKLRINYRTTFEILRWSLNLLEGESFDDLDEGADTHELAGYHSFLSGPEPMVEGFGSRKEQLDALVERVKRWHENGVALEDIGIATRAGGSHETIQSALKAAGFPSLKLRSDLVSKDGVRVATMHRMKGLEFRCVALPDVDANSVPSQKAITAAGVDRLQHDLDVKRERCLLYVACTRARDDLWIGWAGKPSEFLP
ncbi:MAG: AAA family ATPase [Acidimicrobiales bacterium]